MPHKGQINIKIKGSGNIMVCKPKSGFNETISSLMEKLTETSKNVQC